jgi:hypothetical protein
MNRPKRLFRNPAANAVEVEGEIFLVDPATEDVIHLNKLASGLWRYLAEPRRPDEIAEVFAAAFPRVRRARLMRDVNKAISDLKRRALIVSRPAAGGGRRAATQRGGTTRRFR